MSQQFTKRKGVIAVIDQSNQLIYWMFYVLLACFHVEIRTALCNRKCQTCYYGKLIVDE